MKTSLRAFKTTRGEFVDRDLIGCEDRELESIEQQYGTLPLAHKQIMKLLGGRDRKWLCISAEGVLVTLKLFPSLD